MKVKKKITKKKLKQPDEFISFTEQSFLFMTKHSKQIAIGVAIVLVLVLSFVLFRMWNQKKEDEAQQRLAIALEAYQMASSPYREGLPEEYKRALEGFEEVIKSFSGTRSARLSLLYKGGIHLRLGEFDEAIKAYETFLKKVGKEKFYQLLALEGLGYAYEGKKDYEKALKAYEEIIKQGDSFDRAGAHLYLARCYERVGNNDEAIRHYNHFLQISPKSFFTNPVLRKVSLLEK